MDGRSRLVSSHSLGYWLSLLLTEWHLFQGETAITATHTRTHTQTHTHSEKTLKVSSRNSQWCSEMVSQKRNFTFAVFLSLVNDFRCGLSLLVDIQMLSYFTDFWDIFACPHIQITLAMASRWKEFHFFTSWVDCGLKENHSNHHWMFWLNPRKSALFCKYISFPCFCF